jgi:subtilisin-like proprotein convertase family protein
VNSPRGSSRRFLAGRLAPLVCALAPLAAPAGASTTETFITVTFLPIPSTGTWTTTLSIPTTGSILDLDVTLQIAHANVSELTVRLIHPDGVTSALLVDRRCGTGDGYAVALSDEAADPISGQAGNCANVLNGIFRPEQPLSVFDGRTTAGTWTLEIEDHASSTSGTLYGWSLVLLYELKAGKIQHCNPTGVPIPDPGEATSETASGEAVPVADLDVEIDVAHPEIADLDVALRAPDLTTVDLVAIPGACDGFDLTLSDEAAAPLPDGCADGTTLTGTYRPASPLSGFDGIAGSGTWQLRVEDGAAGEDGALEGWCLRFDFGLFRDGFEEFGDTRYWSETAP